MLNFPYPYEDELVYSVLARASAHFCSFSHKGWLELTLKNRCAIATIEFPSHLDELAKLFFLGQISATQLIYQNTLFPLYAPFIPEAKRNACIEWMRGKANGGPHLATGWAASRIPKINTIRYCPMCLNEQKESYWQRKHQVVGLSTCEKHNCHLESLDHFNHKRHRHEFYPASRHLQSFAITLEKNVIDERLDSVIQTLLERPELPSASFLQWTNFYHHLIEDCRCNKGKYCCYEALKERVLAKWPKSWLLDNNLFDFSNENSWLHCISRKHRKSFSYLEHIVLLTSLYDHPLDINEVLHEVSEEREISKCSQPSQAVLQPSEATDRAKSNWLTSVIKIGAKLSRKRLGGLYMWLYRNHHDWLVNVNQRYKRDINNKTHRVCWDARDLSTVKQLISIRNEAELDINLPRQSKLWFIQQLNNKAAVEKKLAKLPLTSMFLERYQETVEEYQIRRLTRTLLEYSPRQPAEWRLLRESGLSEERITAQAKEFIKRIL